MMVNENQRNKGLADAIKAAAPQLRLPYFPLMSTKRVYITFPEIALLTLIR